MAIRRPRRLAILATAVASLRSAPGALAAVHERRDLLAHFAAAGTSDARGRARRPRAPHATTRTPSLPGALKVWRLLADPQR